MPPVKLDHLWIVSERLNLLDVNYAFLGGAVLWFLLDNPSLVRLRITDDVDAIVNVISFVEHVRLEGLLRTNGFVNDASVGAPICRWLYNEVTIDIMPVKDHTGTMDNRWFNYALQTASMKTYKNITIPTISASCFLATKLVAFQDRGSRDLYTSHDLEDTITLVNGRECLLDELKKECPELREFVASRFSDLLGLQIFHDVVPGLIEQDSASQQRLPWLMQRITDLANVK